MSKHYTILLFGGICLEGSFSFEMDTTHLDRVRLVHALAELSV